MNHEEQLQDELALIDLEKRQLLVERRELELKQQLSALKRRKQTQPVIVDLTEDQDDEVILKQEPEADLVGQPTLQDTVTAPLPDDNNNTTGAPLAANFARCENDSKSQLPKVEKQDGSSPQPEDVHDSKGSGNLE